MSLVGCSPPVATDTTSLRVSLAQLLIRLWRAQWAIHYRNETEKALLLRMVTSVAV